MFEERKQARFNILEEIYGVYFNTGQGKVTAKYDRESDLEKRLAMEYLLIKGLITENHKGGQNFEYKITVHGIDVVEGNIEMPGL